MHIDDNLRAGMTPEQARRNAILKLGGVEATKEACRDRSTVPFLENLLQDVRFAIRQLRKNPGFTSTAILMLALGMCASVAIFAFVDAALIKPLPYRNPARLVGVFESVLMFPQRQPFLSRLPRLEEAQPVFSSLDAYTATVSPEHSDRREKVPRRARDRRILSHTRRHAILGRDFHAGEDLPRRPAPCCSATPPGRSGTAEKRMYSADRHAERRSLHHRRRAAAGLSFRSRRAARSSGPRFNPSGSCEMRRSCHNLYGVARLKDGVRFRRALADMKAIAQQLEKQYPDSNRDQGAAVVPLSEVIVGDVRPILLVLLSGAGLLLVDCLRERRESAAGPLGEPPARDRGPQCAGCIGGAVDRPICNRRIGSGSGGQCARASVAACWAMRSSPSSSRTDMIDAHAVFCTGSA